MVGDLEDVVPIFKKLEFIPHNYGLQALFSIVEL